MTPRSLGLYALVSAAAFGLAFPAAAQQQVGVSSAVNPATLGAPPGATARQLVVGENIVFNEHITTGPDGQTQILFVDESAMSVGPNSDMTIDEFVYDPKTGTGSEALSATRGVFRYVGGKLSKLTDPVTVKTPVATIGIRGGVFVMNLQPGGHLDVVFLYGKGLTITGLNGTSQTITRPGFSVSVTGQGAAPSAPAPAAKAALASFLSQLDGRSGGNGGSSQVPTDTSVANSGVSNTISNNVVASVQAAIQSQAATQGVPQAQATPINQPVNLNLNTVTSQSQQVIQQAIATNGATTTPIAPPTAPDTTGISGGFTGISTASAATGFTNQVFPYSGGVVKNGVFIATIGTEQVTFPLAQGTGTVSGVGTTSQHGNFNATTVVNADDTFFYANASLVNDPTKQGFIYGGLPVSQSAYAATGSPQFLAFQVQPDGALQSAIPFVRTQTGGALTGASVSPLYLAVSPTAGFGAGQDSGVAFPKALQSSLAINGTGANQSSVLVVATGNAFTPGSSPLLNGIAEGSYRPNGTSPSTLISTSYLSGVDGANNSFYGGNSIAGFVLTPNNCCNADGTPIQALATETNTQTGGTTNYGFVQPAVAVTAPAIATGPQTTQTLQGFFGGTMTGTQGGVATPYMLTGGTTISTDATNLQIAAVLGGANTYNPSQSGVSSVLLSYGSLAAGNTGAREGYINDNLFGVLEAPGGGGSSVNNSAATNANLYLVNANAVPNTALAQNGVTFCNCQYLQWGYWGGEVDSGSGATARTDIAHINTWVAGIPTPTADINNLISMSATAGYGGAAIGSVNNNGVNYLAAGAFSLNYNFGNQTGMTTISGFDGGQTFTGTVHGAGNTAAFAGPLSGTNIKGSTAGSFYGPNAAETGGSFSVQSITGAPYIAAGTFAGVKKN